ncbi:hypothetical protein [Nocardia aurantiaca]|nr:hypothetical protein [Nocardia aurantiaca]
MLGEIDDPAALPLVEATRVALERVADIGLGLLSLDRATSTLSAVRAGA